MSGLERIALGYDLRLSPAQTVASWLKYRDSSFQILRSIAAPLSLENGIWNSVFYPKGAIFDNPENEVMLERVSDRWIVLDLWDNVEELFDCARTNPKLSKHHWLMAAEIINDPSARGTWSGLDRLPALSFNSPTWDSLGFDVTNDEPLSAIFNNTCSKDEQDKLVANYADKLNANGLFSRFQDAEDYKTWTSDFYNDCKYYIVELFRLPFCKL